MSHDYPVLGRPRRAAPDRFLNSGVSFAARRSPSGAADELAASLPSTATPPAVGTVRPTHRCNSVVLPAPSGPASTATFPDGIASVHSRSAQAQRESLGPADHHECGDYHPCPALRRCSCEAAGYCMRGQCPACTDRFCNAAWTTIEQNY